MIPIRDDVPHTTTPWVNYFLIAMNTAVFVFELLLAPAARNEFIFQFGVVPSHTMAFLAGAQGMPAIVAFLPLLTSLFLHGGWFHIIGNMWFLWIFGDNVEDYLGHGRYLLMYLLAGIAGSLLHIGFNPGSEIPSVGASGAIAGVMGAYFLLYPRARVLTLVPFFFVFFVWLPAWIMLGYWFLVQFLGGAAAAIAYSRESSGGVAVWAHVGGFCAGLLMIKVFRSRPRRYQYMTWN
jgi:membrane associated rhomboid family serine protease